MATVAIAPGACGLNTRVTATYDEESGQAILTIETDCDMVRQLAAALPEVDAQQAVFTPPPRNPIYLASASLLHASCVVPAAMVRAIEAAAGWALPRDIIIRFVE